MPLPETAIPHISLDDLPAGTRPAAWLPAENGGNQGTQANGTSDDKAVQKRADEPAKKHARTLHITFRPCGQFERDKYRLHEIFEAVRDPKGRDQFTVVLETKGHTQRLAFPNEFCTVNERLVHELRSHFKVAVTVEDQKE